MGEVAYKPIGSIRPSDADYKIISQIPTYDDVGVSFKGYSKKKISENTYQLNPKQKRELAGSSQISRPVSTNQKERGGTK